MIKLNRYNLKAAIYLYHLIMVNWPTIPSRYQLEVAVSLYTAAHHLQASSSCFSNAFPNLWNNLFSLVSYSIARSIDSFCQYLKLFASMCDSSNPSLFSCFNAGCFKYEIHLH